MTTLTDRTWLESWIQPQHLEPDALRAHHDAFVASPVQLVVVKDLLQPAIAERLSRFLLREAEYTPTFGSHLAYGKMSEAAYLALPEADRFFRFGLLSKSKLVWPRSKDADLFLDFSMAVADPRMRVFFEAVSGYALGKSETSVRSMRRGDLLARHRDDIGARRLSYFIYLTPGWQPGFGGELVMERDGGAPELVVPEYNSCAIFDVRAWHYIAPMSEAAGDAARVTFGGWYHAATG
ncbi:MAG: 2OG-Fe(II) oxygenase family protein [Myxococcota bacterium]